MYCIISKLACEQHRQHCFNFNRMVVNEFVEERIDYFYLTVSAVEPNPRIVCSHSLNRQCSV
jgi:hypothetical protein